MDSNHFHRFEDDCLNHSAITVLLLVSLIQLIGTLYSIYSPLSSVIFGGVGGIRTHTVWFLKPLSPAVGLRRRFYAMTIRTQKLKIFFSIVIIFSVDMINFQNYFNASPFIYFTYVAFILNIIFK